MAEVRSRRGLSWHWVGAGFGALLLLGIATAVAIYFRLIRYDRVAAHHLPPDTLLAIRADVEHAIMYEPFRKHLLPLVNRGQIERGAGPVLAPRIERLKQKTGVDLGVDLREFVIARGASWNDWVLIIGGKFPKSGVVSGLSALLSEEGVENRIAADGRSLNLAAGPAVGQASDGALLMASSAMRLELALPRQRTYELLGLSLNEAAAFAVSGAPFSTLATLPLATLSLAFRELARAESVSGLLKLGAEPKLEGRVRLNAGADAALVAGELQRAISMEGASWLPLPFLENKASLLRRVHFRAGGPSVLSFSLVWERADLDWAAESFAKALGSWSLRAHGVH